MESRGPGVYIAAVVAIVVGIIFFLVAFPIRGVDSGEVGIVRQGGPFDGRGIAKIRQPGSGPAFIGAFNHQDTLPATQRDLTDEVGSIVVPTADGVNVVVDGQALFALNTNPDAVTKFYLGFGRRKWDGHSLGSDEGWRNFLRIRMVPILFQSIRQTIGTYGCTQLNNTCVYVLNANVLADVSNGSLDKASKQAQQANTEQNLSAAELGITRAFQKNLKAGLGDYFDGVRFQNLRVTFPQSTQAKVQAAQNARADVATAKLQAQRNVQQAEGQTQVARQQAEQIRLKAKAYQTNPQQAAIDKIRALCGDRGCTGLQVIGGNATTLLGGTR